MPWAITSTTAGGGAAAGRPPVLLTASDATRIVGSVDAADVSGRFSVDVPAGSGMSAPSSGRHAWAWDTGYTVEDCLNQTPGMILSDLAHPEGSGANLVWYYGLAFRADTAINFASDRSAWAAIQIGRGAEANTRRRYGPHKDNDNVGSDFTFDDLARADLKVPLLPDNVQRKTWLLHGRNSSTALERIGQGDATLTTSHKVIAWAVLDLCGTVATAQTFAGKLYFVPPAGDWDGI